MVSGRAIILFGRGSRAFAIGALAVATPLLLRERGYGESELTRILSAGLAGATLQTQILTHLSDRFGRILSLAISTVAMALAAASLAIETTNPWLLPFTAFLGGMSLQPNISVQGPLEQASLADLVSGPDRATTFATYNGISTIFIAIGSLAVGLPIWSSLAQQVLAASLLLFLTAGVYVWASMAVTPTSKDSLLKVPELTLRQCPHLKRIVAMAFLFGVDSFAGGMVMNSFIVHWMSDQRDMKETVLGSLFAASGVITTPSLWIAAWLGNRIGLINTMVFTHLPSNVGMIVMPFIQSQQGICGVTMFRAALSQMDVPARDAFMMSVVEPEERVACSSFITAARGLACILGPPFASALWKRFSPGTPLIVAGVLKCVYDISLLFTFRAVQVKM